MDKKTLSERDISARFITPVTQPRSRLTDVLVKHIR